MSSGRARRSYLWRIRYRVGELPSSGNFPPPDSPVSRVDATAWDPIVTVSRLGGRLSRSRFHPDVWTKEVSVTDPQGSAAAFTAVPTEVQDAGKFVQLTAEALVNGIRSADSEVVGLMSTWKGAAADAYLTGWDEAKTGALEVLDALAVMAELLGVVAVSYASVDDRTASGLAALNMGTSTATQPGGPTGPLLNM